MEEYNKKFIAFEAVIDVFSEVPVKDIKSVLGMLIVHYAQDIANIFGDSKDDFMDSLLDEVIEVNDAIDELKKSESHK